MGITISFGIQKGGVGKTTTTGITSWILANKGFKVLAIDFDSQGNLTQFLTQRDPYDFTGKTALQACKDKDPRPYIHPITDNLHIIPAEDFLSQLSRYLFNEYTKQCWADGTASRNPHFTVTLLKETIEVVKDEYDFILIDLPPNLGEQTLNGIVASDFVVVIMQAEPFCRSALDRYLETVLACIDKVNPNIQIAGIVTSLHDSRTNMSKGILADVQDAYDTDVFKTVIKRRARVVEFAFDGIKNDSREDKEALSMFEDFVKELIDRVERGSYTQEVAATEEHSE
jgi:chromosome partitioning protein